MWVEHLMNNEASIQRQLTSRINALQKISYAATFKTRKIVAARIVTRKSIYTSQNELS